MVDRSATEPIHEITIDRRVAVPMRDGTILRADVYRPVTPGRYPVIVERVAYELDYRVGPYASFFAERGYVFVGQNVRGTFWSEGEHDFRNDGWGERKDGYDTIEWAGAQPWSNGRVGTMDGSYSGYTQYALAPTRPPHLTSMFVRSGVSNIYQELAAPGGVQRDSRAGLAQHLLFNLKHDSAPPGSESVIAGMEKALAEPTLFFDHLPLRDNPDLAPSDPSFVRNLDHADDGPYWELMNPLSMLHEAGVPVFHMSGWFDFLLPAVLNAYGVMRERAHTEFARENQHLLVGPWRHAEFSPDEDATGDLEFGSDAAIGLNNFRLRWFEHWLKELRSDVADLPRVRIFVMGDNEWENHDEWPPAGVEYRSMYFHQGSGQTEESLNNGALSLDVPGASEQQDSYDYDPMDPVPGGAPATDVRANEGRMLTYTSSALEQDLKVVGPLKVTLYASSSARDTDWFVRLCDVWPDGRSIQIQSGQLRARYRNSFEEPALMDPGEVYEFEIDLLATANVFKAGHKIRVQVTSSEYPMFGRNLNTGGVNAAETVGVVARNTIFHDAARPSHILLPVIG